MKGKKGIRRKQKTLMPASAVDADGGEPLFVRLRSRRQAVEAAVRGTNIRGICHLRIFIERLSNNDKNES